MKILFLDDDRERWSAFKHRNLKADIHWASSNKQAFDLCSDNSIDWDVIFLDHDLGIDDKGDFSDAIDFVKFMVEKNVKTKLVILHSMNPVGRENQLHLLKSYGYNVIEVSESWRRTSYDPKKGLVIT